MGWGDRCSSQVTRLSIEITPCVKAGYVVSMRAGGRVGGRAVLLCVIIHKHYLHAICATTPSAADLAWGVVWWGGSLVGIFLYRVSPSFGIYLGQLRNLFCGEKACGSGQRSEHGLGLPILTKY